MGIALGLQSANAIVDLYDVETSDGFVQPASTPTIENLPIALSDLSGGPGTEGEFGSTSIFAQYPYRVSTRTRNVLATGALIVKSGMMLKIKKVRSVGTRRMVAVPSGFVDRLVIRYIWDTAVSSGSVVMACERHGGPPGA